MTLQFLTDDLIGLRESADIEVKKSALEALTSIIHSNWVSMKSQLVSRINEILQFALMETNKRLDLKVQTLQEFLPRQKN